jgi:hypothetical protein
VVSADIDLETVITETKNKIAAFNQLLLEAGFAEKIYVSPGYWYFLVGDSARWKETAVFDLPFKTVTIEQVIQRLKEFQSDNRKVLRGGGVG